MRVPKVPLLSIAVASVVAIVTLSGLSLTAPAHAQSETKRFLYLSTPDGAQRVGRADGAGILIYDIDNFIYLCFCDDESRCKNNNITIVSNDHAVVVTVIPDEVTDVKTTVKRCLLFSIFYQKERLKQTHPTHLPDDRILLLQIFQLIA